MPSTERRGLSWEPTLPQLARNDALWNAKGHVLRHCSQFVKWPNHHQSSVGLFDIASATDWDLLRLNRGPTKSQARNDPSFNGPSFDGAPPHEQPMDGLVLNDQWTAIE